MQIEDKESKKTIKLSYVLASYLWPVYINKQDDFANQILSRMAKK